MLATVDWGKLGELLWVAPVAALVVITTFAVMIFGVARAGDARRTGAAATATLFGVVGLLGGAAFVGAVVFGIAVIVGG
jgi:hypothetical protein